MPLQALLDATRELRGARADVQKLAGRYRIARLLVIGLALGLAVIGYDSYATHSTLGCVTDWAAKTAARSKAIDKPTRNRDAALDKLVVDIGRHAGQRDVALDVDAAAKASKARLDAVNAHPVPPPPLSDCGPGW